MNVWTRRQKATDLPRINRSKAALQRERILVRVQVDNVLARNCSTIGVQDTPKSFTGSFMRNAEPQRLRPSGQANRKACCWRSGLRYLKEAKALAVMARDIPIDSGLRKEADIWQVPHHENTEGISLREARK
jgi:hypothetical protein